MGKIYNVIDSVKGGCGKTSFAIMLAAALYHDCKEEPVCLFDMDMQGTSLAYLLLGKTSSDEWKRRANIDVFFNERILQAKKDDLRYITKIEWNDKPDDDLETTGMSGAKYGAKFYAAISSPLQSEKNKYRAKSNQNYSPEVTYGIFRYGLSELLREEALGKQMQEKVQHIIFDMPPNSDGYSDGAIDCVLNEKKSPLKQDRCNYFIMLTLDRAHQNATMEWFKSFLTQDQNRKYSDRIFFAISMTPRDNYNNANIDAVKECIKQIKNSIESELKMVLPETERDKIYFIGVNFIKKYYDLCCTQDGITNYAVDLAQPICYIEDYYGNTVMDAVTKACLQVMRGKSLKD